MYKFICRDCNLIFENDTRTKMEYKDPIYGNCWKYIALCPQCGQECSEKSDPNPAKAKKNVSMDCGFSGCRGNSCQNLQNMH